MAKPKLQTSKKRVNKKKEELEAPDEVTTSLHRLSDHLSKHLKLYVIGLVAILAVALIITWLVERSRASEVERAAKLNAAVDALLGTVATYADSEQFAFAPAGDTPTKADFADEAERTAGIDKAIAEAEDIVDDETEELLTLVKARAAMIKGDPKAAVEGFSAFTAEESDSSLLPVILETQGNAARNAGDAAAAAGFYEKLTTAESLYWKVRGHMLLGDLANPNFGSGGDKAKAAAQYDQALELLKPAEGQVFNASLRMLRGEIARRKAQL